MTEEEPFSEEKKSECDLPAGKAGTRARGNVRKEGNNRENGGNRGHDGRMFEV